MSVSRLGEAFDEEGDDTDGGDVPPGLKESSAEEPVANGPEM